MVREIACPGNSLVPLHLASYDSETETLACPLCGKLSADELSARLSAEMLEFEQRNPGLAPAPFLADDETEAERVALKLFRAFPSEATFAAEAAEALIVQTFAGRISREHVALCIDLAFTKYLAGR
jgi:hypothetical protein